MTRYNKASAAKKERSSKFKQGFGAKGTRGGDPRQVSGCFCRRKISGSRLNIKTVFPSYGDSHVKDKTVAKLSYLKHGDPYMDKTTSLYWNAPPLVTYDRNIFSCDQAALWMVFSVCLSVCLSVCPSHLFDYVPIIVSSRYFQELSPRTRVTSMQNVKVRGQRSRSQRSQPNLAVSGL